MTVAMKDPTLAQQRHDKKRRADERRSGTVQGKTALLSGFVRLNPFLAGNRIFRTLYQIADVAAVSPYQQH